MLYSLHTFNVMEFMLTNTMNLLSWKSNSLDKVTHVKIHLILCQVLSGLPRPAIGKLDLQSIGSSPDLHRELICSHR